LPKPSFPESVQWLKIQKASALSHSVQLSGGWSITNVQSENSRIVCERSGPVELLNLPSTMRRWRRMRDLGVIAMGQRLSSRAVQEHVVQIPADIDDAAAVYPDHDIIMRHFEGPLTLGDFVSALADGAEGHGGLPTYLRITLQGDASKLRRLVDDERRSRRRTKRTTH
jgi:hypothetical protein